MDAQTRLKLVLGDLLFQLSVAHARIEELEAEAKPNTGGNGFRKEDARKDEANRDLR